MKKLILAVFFSLIATPSHADEVGAWVKVNASGIAIGQAIVCTAAVCGDPNSLYSQLTLKPGESYVLQTVGDANGNVVGIGAGQRQNTQVKVDLQTKEWTAKTTTVVEVKPTPLVTAETVGEKPQKVTVEAATTIVEKINKNATMELVSKTAEIKTKVVETPPLTEPQEVLDDWYADFLREWQAIFDALATMFFGWQLLW